MKSRKLLLDISWHFSKKKLNTIFWHPTRYVQDLLWIVLEWLEMAAKSTQNTVVYWVVLKLNNIILLEQKKTIVHVESRVVGRRPLEDVFDW